MPTYDYECTKCGHTFDAFQSMSDAPLSTCPECKKKSLRRLIGGGLGVIFKGSGFYVTDSRGGKSAASTAKTEGGSDSKKDSGSKTDSGSSGGSSEGSSGGSKDTAKSGAKSGSKAAS